jgi:HK97 family phage major capsid protein
MAFLTTPEVKQDAKTTARFSNTDTPLWIGSAAQGELIGYRAMASNQVKKNLGAGTDEHGIVFGVWSELLIGEWGAVQITVDPYTKAGQDVTRVIARAFVDIDLRHPQAFCTGAGLVPA